jgi:predicted transcriptional regulator
MTTERLSLRIDANLKKNLEQEARREERSASYLAVKAIEAMLRDRAEKRAAIRAAVSEAGAGAFISQEAMDAWVSSWGEDAELPPPEPDVQIASQ